MSPLTVVFLTAGSLVAVCAVVLCAVRDRARRRRAQCKQQRRKEILDEEYISFYEENGPPVPGLMLSELDIIADRARRRFEAEERAIDARSSWAPPRLLQRGEA